MASATQETAGLSAQERSSVFRSVLNATMGLEFGLGLQHGIFNNFVVEVLRIRPEQLGLVQSIREIPGLLTAPIATLQRFFKENVWAGICLLLAGVGLFLHTVVGSFAMLIVATLVLSTGFHVFYPAQSSIVMKTALPSERGMRMGQMNSGAAAATLASVLVVMAISRGRETNYPLLHLVAAVFSMLGGALVLTRPMPGVESATGSTAGPAAGAVAGPSAGSSVRAAAKSLRFDPRLLSYYILSLLGGSRRQITTTFAGFLLVESFHTPVATMVLLSAISSLIAIVTRPAIGKVVDSCGEQNCLIANYGLVAVLFAGYALVKTPLTLFAIYILDNGLLGFDVAITTHLGKIAPKEALSPAYAMGQTVNHITGVGVPLFGGFLWKAAGGASVFFGGAAISLGSLMYSRYLREKDRREGAKVRKTHD